MSRRRLTVPAWAVGALVFAGLGGALAFAAVSHRGLPWQEHRYVTVAFEELPASLREGADARVAGVRVGQVHDIAYEDGEARVRLQFPADYELFADATARIRSRSSLGQKFVEVHPGTRSAGPLGEQPIPRERTASLTEIDEVLSALDPPTRAALSTTVRELGAGAGGRARDLADIVAASPELLADLGVTAEALSAEDARLVAFLAVSERLAGRFAGRVDDLARLNGQMAETFSALAADGSLREALDRLPATLDALTPALGDLGTASGTLAGAVNESAPGAAGLGAAVPALRGALRESPPTLAKVPPVGRLAEPAFGDLAATFRDARPLAPALRRLISSFRIPIEVLAPYAPEASLVNTRLAEALSTGDAAGNWLRVLNVQLSADKLSNFPGAPGMQRNPYPAPGEASTDRSAR
jgi:phospholipid/cholesterol/gamma-HCH transport system substrate-binding protein